jgi:hypothetical protein
MIRRDKYTLMQGKHQKEGKLRLELFTEGCSVDINHSFLLSLQECKNSVP